MDATRLIVKLIAVEQSLETKAVSDTRDLVLQAQDYALELERQMLDVLHENERLRQSAEKYQQLTPARLSELRLPLVPALPNQAQMRPLPADPPARQAGGLLTNWQTLWRERIRREKESNSPCPELNKALDRVALNSWVRAGTLLFRQDESPAAIFLVRSGSIALEWTTDHGVIPLDPLGPGRLVGLPAVLHGAYSVTARAAEDTELGYIPVTWVMQLLAHDPDLCLAVSRMAARELTEIQSLIVNSRA